VELVALTMQAVLTGLLFLFILVLGLLYEIKKGALTI
jgi:NADH:ubiquinone oxidoreductase subunit 3 (subunit A)